MAIANVLTIAYDHRGLQAPGGSNNYAVIIPTFWRYGGFPSVNVTT
jgi:hypothetical protein